MISLSLSPTHTQYAQIKFCVCTLKKHHWITGSNRFAFSAGHDIIIPIHFKPLQSWPNIWPVSFTDSHQQQIQTECAQDTPQQDIFPGSCCFLAIILKWTVTKLSYVSIIVKWLSKKNYVFNLVSIRKT